MNALITSLCALCLALLATSCIDGPLSPHQGDRGYPCSAHDACLEPLLCLDVPEVDFLVCSGNALEGEACSEDTPCAWLRDTRGLPLQCEAGVCSYPPDGGS